MELKRAITHKEEQAYRMCHHDFGGLSIKEAAKKMGVKVRGVQRLLCNLKKKSPRLFPILTPRRRAIIALYDQGDFELRKGVYVWTHTSRKAVAAGLNITLDTLAYEIAFLRRHKFLWDRTMDQFDGSMHDGQIKEKF